jgi:hypothetical protein
VEIAPSDCRAVTEHFILQSDCAFAHLMCEDEWETEVHFGFSTQSCERPEDESVNRAACAKKVLRLVDRRSQAVEVSAQQPSLCFP